MTSFLEFWLCTLTLTLGGLVHQALTGGNYIGALLLALFADFAALFAFAVYWMILYPRYFTPLSGIPTPAVSSSIS